MTHKLKRREPKLWAGVKVLLREGRIMTREQAEANWIWDPKRGDLRPKEWPKNGRIRPTDRNIMAQQIARAGTLIHTAAKTTCPRKACKIDERHDEKGNVTQLAIAGFIENVNCLWCRKDYFKRGRE